MGRNTTCFLALIALLLALQLWAAPPRIVGVPPADAARDLCVTADGEIRHYGWRHENGSRVRVYCASRDGGENWTTHLAATNDAGAMVKSPWSGEWISFAQDDTPSRTAWLIRSKRGPGYPADVRMSTGWARHELRQLFPLKTRKRWIALFSDTRCENGECYHSAVAYSDDDGKTWRRVAIAPVPNVARLHPGDRRPHWFNDGCEPTAVERKDGSLLMIVRTSGEHHAAYESFDGGETWSAGRELPAFWAANTMPYLFRLSDGRILFFWNNTSMLPTRDVAETPEIHDGERRGVWEVVFTNRDVLHAAISDDDGKTWKGFREVALNEVRNACDFRELGEPGVENDKSVHQTQAIELKDGKVLLAYGQCSVARRLAIFDPDWLLETSREEDFRRGLGALSNHLYVRTLLGGYRGWSGHCAWNRIPGALLVRDPDLDGSPIGRPRSVRDVLQLCRIRDPRLVSDRQGVVWNFPAAKKGVVTVECRRAGTGFRLTLADHWFNPCDEVAPGRSPASFVVSEKMLPKDRWVTLMVAWDESAHEAVLSRDGVELAREQLKCLPPFGLSYLHLQTLAEETDSRGVFFRCFRQFTSNL